mgnify:CR=1 FL=1
MPLVDEQHFVSTLTAEQDGNICLRLPSISEQNESSKPTSKRESTVNNANFLNSMVTMRSLIQQPAPQQ